MLTGVGLYILLLQLVVSAMFYVGLIWRFGRRGHPLGGVGMVMITGAVVLYGVPASVGLWQGALEAAPPWVGEGLAVAAAPVRAASWLVDLLVALAGDRLQGDDLEIAVAPYAIVLAAALAVPFWPGRIKAG